MSSNLNYLVFIEDDQGREKLVGTTSSLAIAKASAAWMTEANNPKREVVSALLCCQEDGGPVREMARYKKGGHNPDILSSF